ncbi:hypothetical protein [Agrobacterium rosae]|uniref:hypothetical protein n=1 Tax=Agrobacterium rosae TaxID=1972867 RepID=UPI00097D555C|nr:hypothetical protein [Agrobacterium rosae]
MGIEATDEGQQIIRRPLQEECQANDDARRIDADDLASCYDIRTDGDESDIRVDVRSQASELGVVAADVLQDACGEAHGISINDDAAGLTKPNPVLDS